LVNWFKIFQTYKKSFIFNFVLFYLLQIVKSVSHVQWHSWTNNEIPSNYYQFKCEDMCRKLGSWTTNLVNWLKIFQTWKNHSPLTWRGLCCHNWIHNRKDTHTVNMWINDEIPLNYCQDICGESGACNWGVDDYVWLTGVKSFKLWKITHL
jgi:hypothetical protein